MRKKKLSTGDSVSVRVVSGGRMTKWKGQAASISPCLSLFLSSVSLLAFSLVAPSGVSAGSCAGTGGVFTCTGTADPADGDVTQSLTGAPLTVTTSGGFGLSVGTGDGFSMQGTGGLTFTDNYASNITSATGHGVYAQNRDSGDLTITVSGTVHGNGGDGVYARVIGTGSASVSSTGTVIGAAGDGIAAVRFNIDSAGDVTVTAADVTGAEMGVSAVNFGIVAGNVTVTTKNATGGDLGIIAQNNGTGTVSVDALGTVQAGTDTGIFALQRNTGMTGDVTVKAVDVTGQTYGIIARNNGTGSVNVTSTGTVTGTTYDGILARQANSSDAGDVTVTAAKVTGMREGILALNDGTGAVTVNASDVVEAKTEAGIIALQRNTGSTGDVTITTIADVTGAENGIRARNDGEGGVVVTSTGGTVSATGTAEPQPVFDATTGTVTTTGYKGTAVYVSRDTGGGDVTISVEKATGTGFGVYARNNGLGNISISSTGDITGTKHDGISAALTNSETTGDLTIAAADVTGAERGIFARNRGAGALSVTATGTVSGTADDGIYVSNEPGTDTLTSNTTGDVTVVAADVTGKDGIDARNFGTGALMVTSTGTVTGQGGYAINAYSGVNGTDVKVSVAEINGRIRGSNRGTGELSVTASGTVTNGILTTNSSAGTNLTISAADVQSTFHGIDADNNGSGALNIILSGNVTASNGIFADNSSNGTDMTISVVDVQARHDAITAVNNGSGTLSLTATGTVTGGKGIFAFNNDDAKDLTVSVVDVTGYDEGIWASNFGTGALSVTATGTVTATKYGKGIDAFNSDYGTDLTVSAVDVTGNDEGISAVNYGTGALSVTATGTVSSKMDDGIYVSNSAKYSNATGDVTVAAVDVTGDRYGIDARNYGTGALSVTATGTVTGTNYDGISLVNSKSGAGLTLSASDVTGKYNAIDIENMANGGTDITLSGVVNGGTEAGVDISTVAGSTVNVTLEEGASVGSENGQAIVEGAANTNLLAQAGSAITGHVSLGSGSDTVFIEAGVNLSAQTVLDGGDDASSADGFIDTLTLGKGVGISALSGTNLLNWEQLVIDGLELTTEGDAIAVGDGTAGTGLVLSNGSSLTMGAGYVITGSVSVGSDSILNAVAGGTSISGSLGNDGLMTLQDDSAGDVITVAGDLTGTGDLAFDTVLGEDGAATDMLVVGGDFAADAQIFVENVGGTGAPTTAGIMLVDIGGDLTGSATLVGDYVTDDGQQAVIEGTFAYTLVQNENGDLVLMSQDTDPVDPVTVPRYQPGAPVYEAYLDNLHALNRLPSYRERRGAMRSGGSGVPAGSIAFAPGIQPETSPFWFRNSAAHSDSDANKSTTDTNGHINQFMIDGGADMLLSETPNGQMFGGLVLSYGYAHSDVDSRFGDGSVKTNAFGVGLTGSWVGNGGFYFDGQAKYNWFWTDLKSHTLGKLENNNDGHGIVASIEVGQSFAGGYGLTFTPQAQLMYSDVDFDSFTGPSGERISKDDGDRWELRTGLVVEKQVGQKPEEVIYGLANVYYTLDRSSKVDVSGITLSNSPKKFSYEAGVGGQAPLSANAHIFGEVAGRSAFDGDFSVRGSLGVKWAF